MSSGGHTNMERDRQAMLQKLLAAEAALRANLDLNGVDETARAHMERALVHVREAYIAINEVGQARTVQQLVNDVVKVEKQLERVKPSHGGGIKP
jgi:hypothetical protein